MENTLKIIRVTMSLPDLSEFLKVKTNLKLVCLAERGG